MSGKKISQSIDGKCKWYDEFYFLLIKQVFYTNIRQLFIRFDVNNYNAEEEIRVKKSIGN